MNWRKRKRICRKRIDDLIKHGYYENCNYLPCKITSIEVYRSYDGDVQGASLIDGMGSGCSVLSCAPFPLTEAEAVERAEFYKASGRWEYLKKYVAGPAATPEQLDEFRKHYEAWDWFGLPAVSLEAS